MENLPCTKLTLLEHTLNGKQMPLGETQRQYALFISHSAYLYLASIGLVNTNLVLLRASILMIVEFAPNNSRICLWMGDKEHILLSKIPWAQSILEHLVEHIIGI